VREIRTLRAMWRALETEPRQSLTGHEEGNLGYKPRRSLRAAAPVLDPTVRSLTDGVLFEFGPSRQQDLALRDRIRRWQPQLRTLFLMRVASLKYRLQLPGFELPEPVRLLQQEYDDRSAQMLEEMAHRLEGSVPQVKHTPEDSFELLKQKLRAYYAEDSSQLQAVGVQSFVTLLRAIDRLTTSLVEEMATEFDRTE
jgi:multidrug resistance protein MdtO